MRTILTLACFLLFVVSPIAPVSAVVNVTAPSEAEVQMTIDGFAPGFTVEDFLSITPKQIRELTGEKLSLKEAIALKAAQRKIKKELNEDTLTEDTPKSQLVALLLAIFVGALGIHRFYLGYTTIGIVQLLTLGGCGVWALIDLIRIAMGDLGPADGSAYDPTL